MHHALHRKEYRLDFHQCCAYTLDGLTAMCKLPEPFCMQWWALVYPTFHRLLNHHCMPENLKGCGPDLSIAIALTIDTNCTQWLLFSNDSFSLALRHPCFYCLNLLTCLLPSQAIQYHVSVCIYPSNFLYTN